MLDALVDAQRRLDPTLAFRYACRVGMCGSCGMVINGRERWACRTLLKSLKTRIVTVRPLYHFPLIRDLVVDLAPLARAGRAVGAHLRAEGGAGGLRAGRRGRRRSASASTPRSSASAAACACRRAPWWPRRALPGPRRARTASSRWTRTAATRATPTGAAVLVSEDTLMRCHSQANCTDVCPMEISPTESILALRRRAVRGLLG